MLLLFVKMIFKIHWCCVLRTSPANMEQPSSKVGHSKEQMLPQRSPTPGQPSQLHVLLPPTDQRKVTTCCCRLQCFSPDPIPTLTYRARALRKRQYLKNGMNWSCCQRTEWRCQVPSVIVSLPSTGCICRIPKGENM